MVEYVALAVALAGAASSYGQGKRQERQAKRSMQRQEQQQAVARSAAASERLAQATEAKEMRKRKPNTAAIMAKARQKRMSGETFLTGPAGVSPLGQTNYVS
jgi:uncharacterized protein HemX